MKIKKINSAAGLAVMLTLLGHIGVMTFSLRTGWYNYRICKMLSHMTLTFLILHIILSIIIFFFFHDGADARFKRLNAGTIIQRAAAVVMMILIHFHMNAYAHDVTGETLSAGMTAFRIVTELLFFAAVLSHIAVSCGKAFITLGIVRSAKALNVINMTAYIVCAVLMIAAGSGSVSFYLKGQMR
ncbi:MAG: hypothetical protein ACI4JF_08880 [Oscillospiraceae bacterium]